MKPFKTVKTEYYEERDSDASFIYGQRFPHRRIKVVTTTEEWVGSTKDPVTSTTFAYL
jgi:hypothetical protein